MEPKLMFYVDKARTKPVATLDFGDVDVGDEKQVSVFMLNYGETTLRKIKVATKTDGVAVLEQPSELLSGELKKLTLAWTPTKEDLDVDLEVTGLYSKE